MEVIDLNGLFEVIIYLVFSGPYLWTKVFLFQIKFDH